MTDLQHSSLPALLTIQGVEIEAVTYRGERVVTFAQVDKVHKRPEGTAKRNFDENRERFVEGEDFAEIGRDAIRTNLPDGLFSKFAPKGHLLTRRGYLKLVKPMSDDRAWEVQGEMIDRYFEIERQRQLSQIEVILQSAQVLAEVERRQTRQELALDAIGEKVDRVEQAQTILLTRPANAEPIVHLRNRIGKMFGLSAETIDAVMRNSPYAPRVAAMVRHSREEAEGGSYAVYWKKDVTAVFQRFVAECQPVKGGYFSHPFIDKRFRIRATGGAA